MHNVYVVTLKSEFDRRVWHITAIHRYLYGLNIFDYGPYFSVVKMLL